MKDADQASKLRALPSVDALASDARHAGAEAPQPVLVAQARQVIAEARQEILQTGQGPIDLVQRVVDGAARHMAPALPGVINATGILLHTGLGRAPLGPALDRAITELRASYAPVELDMATGKRGKRRRVVEDRLCALTGAEGATVVNNNAAAMVVALGALATGREVIVSRGELVEIGGSFRLPEIIETGGACLKEVGTTNRTRAGDYEKAIGPETGAIMKVHPSNYTVEGFSREAPLAEVARIGRAHGLPVIHDTGSGLLTDALRDAFGLDEPTAESSLRDGADLVLFSGDKLLGGPQAGIIVGRRDLIDTIERHPLMRAVRCDKLTLGVLAETLGSLRDPQAWEDALPVLAMVRRSLDTLRTDAGALNARLAGLPATFETVDCEAFVGGGSAPGQGIASIALRITPHRLPEDEVVARLRTRGVVARIHDGAVMLDLRGIRPHEHARLIEAVRGALTS